MRRTYRQSRAARATTRDVVHVFRNLILEVRHWVCDIETCD
jgi:hypothetical protein